MPRPKGKGIYLKIHLQELKEHLAYLKEKQKRSKQKQKEWNETGERRSKA